MSTYYQKTIIEQLIKIDQLQGTLRALAYRDGFTGFEKELLVNMTSASPIISIFKIGDSYFQQFG